MRYNPRLSVQENAARNQCSVATVRKYIRLNGIDRNYEGKVAKIDKVKAALKRKPEATISTIAQETRLSVNTVKKYLPYALGEKELSKIDTRKVAKVDVRATKDYYATHPSVTLDLLRVESFNHKILEPCCGGGFMAEVIKDAGYDVVASDIIDRGYGKQVDFLSSDFEPDVFDIITNPPYQDVLSFIKKALDLCKKKVAILMPLRYLSSFERYLFYQQYPPVRVYCYVNRINIAKNGRFDLYDDAGANMEIYAWYIWQRGYKGATELRWIENMMKKET